MPNSQSRAAAAPSSRPRFAEAAATSPDDTREIVFKLTPARAPRSPDPSAAAARHASPEPQATPTSLAGTERAWSESSATGGAMDDTMTSLTRGVGTFLYRAPEVAAARPGQRDAGQETKIGDTTSICEYSHGLT